MKTTTFILSLLLTMAAMNVNALKPIKLNAPDKSRGTTVMKALSDRKSTRDFSPKDLSMKDLSDLLWAANGINRTDGKRTAPSAMNVQEVDIYVIMAKGAYRYDAKLNTLDPIAEGDYREAVASRQDFAKAAPVSLVLVSDLSRYKRVDDKSKQFAAADAGMVCQNINIFCAAAGLVTVPRATMDEKKLTEVLKLTSNQVLELNNPVGYPKK